MELRRCLKSRAAGASPGGASGRGVGVALAGLEHPVGLLPCLGLEKASRSTSVSWRGGRRGKGLGVPDGRRRLVLEEEGRLEAAVLQGREEGGGPQRPFAP